MNWTMIGALGELLGAIVVLVSVLYLALQVKQASAHARITTYQRLQSDFVQVQNLLASDAETAALVAKGFRDIEQLTPDERLRFSAFLLTLFRGWETALRYHRRNWIDLESQTMVEPTIREFLTYPGVRSWWDIRQTWFTNDFRSEIAALMAGVEAGENRMIRLGDSADQMPGESRSP